MRDVRFLPTGRSMTETLEDRAWRLAGDELLDSPLEGDDWMLAREALAYKILARLLSGERR